MHLTILRSILLPALERAASAADAKSTMPILNNVRLRASGSALTLSATDLLLSVQANVPCTANKPGDVCVNASALLKSVQAMPDGELTIASDEKHKTSVRAGRKVLNLNGLPGEEFVSLPDAPSSGMDIPASSIHAALSRVSHAISQDDTRAHLCAALLVAGKGELTAVATDGHRLARATISCAGATVDASMLLPARCVQAVLSMLAKASDTTVRVSCASAQGPVFFAREGLTLSSKLVDARFPSWQQVVPHGPFTHTVTVKREDILEALRVMGVVAVKETGAVKIALVPGGLAGSPGAESGSLRMSSDNADVGDASEDISAAVTGPGLVFGVNGQYIADAGKAAPGAEIVVESQGELDPIRLSVVGDAGWEAVVMPMRV